MPLRARDDGQGDSACGPGLLREIMQHVLPDLRRHPTGMSPIACSWAGSAFERRGKWAPAVSLVVGRSSCCRAKIVMTAARAVLTASFLPGLSTLCGIYVAARSSGHIPAGMWWPIISLLGFQPPERYVYVVGFSATGASSCRPCPRTPALLDLP